MKGFRLGISLFLRCNRGQVYVSLFCWFAYLYPTINLNLVFYESSAVVVLGFDVVCMCKYVLIFICFNHLSNKEMLFHICLLSQSALPTMAIQNNSTFRESHIPVSTKKESHQFFVRVSNSSIYIA